MYLKDFAHPIDTAYNTRFYPRHLVDPQIGNEHDSQRPIWPASRVLVPLRSRGSIFDLAESSFSKVAPRATAAVVRGVGGKKGRLVGRLPRRSKLVRYSRMERKVMLPLG